jgi:DNA adenine methylase
MAPWFGSNRTLAENVGAALAGCRWVGVPFCGGMSELLHIDARTLMVGDLHDHVLNLAATVADPVLNPQLRARLDALPFHPGALAAAQIRCRVREADRDDDWFGTVGDEAKPPDLDWAVDYFVCAWMSRNGCAGTRGEFDAGLSIRWEAGGGDSATRFRNATEGLAAWQRVMRRCTFVRFDVFAFLGRVKDQEGHAVYVDPPFPEVGDSYKFAFDERCHERLARELASFERCKVVCRFYDHPLIRKLYPASRWTWHAFLGRRQSNANDAPEVLLTNRVAAAGK